MKLLGNNPEQFADVYFPRSKTILTALNYNPWVLAQVFIRKGPGIVRGIDDAVSILRDYSPIFDHGGEVYVLPEGSCYESLDTLMLIKAPIQDIIALETAYLGVITHETTIANDGEYIDYDKITENVEAVIEAAQGPYAPEGGRKLIYMGARHSHFSLDEMIAAAAFKGGVSECSTDIGAATAGKTGIGTIPHALETVMAYYHGRENAVARATLAFDEIMPGTIPRIALIDYNNNEVLDALQTAELLKGNLSGVRIDTHGGIVGQGGIDSWDNAPEEYLAIKDLIPENEQKYWVGNGVTVSLVHSVRKALDENGYENVGIILSSGFANVEKVTAFTNAESILKTNLYTSLGAGGFFSSRTASMDIIAVSDDPYLLGPDPDESVLFAKTGRGYRPINDSYIRITR